MKIIEKHIVSKEIIGIVRVADYIRNEFLNIETKTGAKKAIKDGRVLIDGTPCTTGTRIKKRQIIELREQKQSSCKIFRLPLEIIYEDDFTAVIYKPAGISVSGNYYKTVQNALAFNLTVSEQKDALQIPLTVHRLDNQTSGLLLIAKTRKARIDLGKQFEEKKIQKKYNALVIGKVPRKGMIDIPIDGKEAITKYECIRTEKSFRNGFLSLLNLYPLTGRTHQLRIHCEKSGFPILGDKLYHANFPVFKGKGLFLSASEITFEHPETKERLTFSYSYPEKFTKIIEREKLRFEMKNTLE